jgi:hypothetical protein
VRAPRGGSVAQTASVTSIVELTRPDALQASGEVGSGVRRAVRRGRAGCARALAAALFLDIDAVSRRRIVQPRSSSLGEGSVQRTGARAAARCGCGVRGHQQRRSAGFDVYVDVVVDVL